MYLSSEIYSKSGFVVAVVIAVFVNNKNADSIIKCAGKQKFTLSEQCQQPLVSGWGRI